MPSVVACPRCSRKLQVPDLCDGVSVRCPACQSVFLAPSSHARESAFVQRMPEERVLEVSHPDPPCSTGQEESVAKVDAAVWTDRDAWARVHSGLGLIAIGIVLSLGVVFLHSLPMLIRLSGVGLVAPNEDEIWNELAILPSLFRGSVGSMVLCFSVFLFFGLLLCLMYPVRGRGSTLALHAFLLFVLWSLGWVVGDSINLLGFISPLGLEQERRRATILNPMGLGLLVVFVLFLHELSRDCSARTVKSRLRWLLAWMGCFAVVALGIELSDRLTWLQEILTFVGMLVLQVQFLRLVLAAREAAGAQCRSLSRTLP